MNEPTMKVVSVEVLPSTSDPIVGKFAKAHEVNEAENASIEIAKPKMSKDRGLNETVQAAIEEVRNCEDKLKTWKLKLSKAKQKLALLKKAASI